MGGEEDSYHNPSGQQVSLPQQPPPLSIVPREDPSLMRIHADDQDKKTICLFWSVLIFLLVLLVIVASFAIPNIYVKNNLARSLDGTTLANCKNPSSNNFGDKLTCQSNPLIFGEVVVGWGPVNQFGLLYLEVRPPTLSQPVKISQDYQLQLRTLQLRADGGGQSFYAVGRPRELNATIDFSSNSADQLYGDDGSTVLGYQYLLAIIINFDKNPFAEEVRFSQNLNINSTSLRLQSYAVNSKFTVYTIVLRYVFFVLAVVGCVLYFLRFVLVPRERRTIEQKMVAVSSVLLLMFNDPFYPLTVLKPNGGSAFFSLLFVVNLIAFLLLFWLVAADRIYFEDGQQETAQLTKKKVAYVGLVWALLIICLMIYTMQQVNGSPIVPRDFARSYTAARVVIGLVVFCGMVYIAARFIRSCMAPEGRTWRSQLFMAFSSAFIIGVFIIVVSNALAPYNYSGSSILVVYTLVNVYVYYLQYMYTITREEAARLEHPEPLPDRQDNYDVITVGTIDLVDVNLDDDDFEEEFNDTKPKGGKAGAQKVEQKSQFEPDQFN